MFWRIYTDNISQKQMDFFSLHYNFNNISMRTEFKSALEAKSVVENMHFSEWHFIKFSISVKVFETFIILN